VKVKLGFKNFYLYSAVNPKTGKDFSLILPLVNTDCINVFLEEFSKELGQQKVLIIMDGAGWHKSKNLKIPSNIRIEILPPYCPELNPVERLWKYIKDNTIKNKVFSTLEELEIEICTFVKNLSREVILGICG
jgi:transposase